VAVAANVSSSVPALRPDRDFSPAKRLIKPEIARVTALQMTAVQAAD
jgi:hypothetical protein